MSVKLLFLKKRVLLILFFLFSINLLNYISAARVDDSTVVADFIKIDAQDKIVELDTLYIDSKNNVNRESIFDNGSVSLGTSHFTWGADVGASIDVGGDDMSSFDVDICLGYKNKLFRTIGVGCGLHRAVGNSCTLIPVYAMVRTSFREQPSLFFLDIKGGYSFNSLTSGYNQNGIYGSIGCGINLAMSNKFMSHIIFSYGYVGVKSVDNASSIFFNKNNIDYVQIKFGVNF